jgi:hypothetical protein
LFYWSSIEKTLQVSRHFLCVFTCITSRGRRAHARGRRSEACVEQTPAVAPYPWRELYLREGEMVHCHTRTHLFSYDPNNPVQIISYIRDTKQDRL